jgi:hypothetical protein
MISGSDQALCEGTNVDKLKLRVTALNDSTGPSEINSLRADLNAHVGPTEFATSPRREGEKSAVSLDALTLIITLLGTPALVALVNVLKSYFDRDSGMELELEGPGGSVKLKLPVGSRLSADQIARALDSVIGAA